MISNLHTPRHEGVDEVTLSSARLAEHEDYGRVSLFEAEFAHEGGRHDGTSEVRILVLTILYIIETNCQKQGTCTRICPYDSRSTVCESAWIDKITGVDQTRKEGRKETV